MALKNFCPQEMNDFGSLSHMAFEESMGTNTLNLNQQRNCSFKPKMISIQCSLTFIQCDKCKAKQNCMRKMHVKYKFKH